MHMGMCEEARDTTHLPYFFMGNGDLTPCLHSHVMSTSVLSQFPSLWAGILEVGLTEWEPLRWRDLRMAQGIQRRAGQAL